MNERPGREPSGGSPGVLDVLGYSLHDFCQELPLTRPVDGGCTHQRTTVGILAVLLVLSGHAFGSRTTHAQTPVTGSPSLGPAAVPDIGALFLHSKGSRDFLDTSAPTATKAQYKDGPSLDKRSSGNAFREIGTWATARADAPRTLNSLAAFYGFVSLKASTDTGATFDIRAELLKNDLLIGTGVLPDVGQLPSFQVGSKAIVVLLSTLSDSSIK